MFVIALCIGCGGRISDSGAPGSGGSASGAGGTGGTGGTTTGTGGGTAAGGTTTGTGGAGATGGTGGNAGVGGAGGATTGTGGSTAAGGTTTGTGGGTAAGGTTTGTGGAGATGGTGGNGGAGGAVDPGPELTACSGPGQCEIVARACCSCGYLDKDRVAAINSSKRDVFAKEVCGINPQPCPPCEATIGWDLMARCEDGHCRAFDISGDLAYTKCTSTEDCVLRSGLSCCECDGMGRWAAVSQTGKMLVSRESCAPNTVCPSCPPFPNRDYIPYCLDGKCVRMVLLSP